MKRLRHHSLIAYLMVCMTACTQDKPSTYDKADMNTHSFNRSVSPSEVLATVNGDPVTMSDLQHSAEGTLGSLGTVMLEGDNRRKVLRGLVTRKAMAKLEEKALTNDEQDDVDARVQAYRERLLARRYIERHTKDLEPSEQDIVAYYNTHAERFGARSFKTYEMVVVDFSKAGPPKANRLKMLKSIENSQNWLEQVQTEEFVTWASHRQGGAELGTLAAPLRKKITALQRGDSPAIIMTADHAYMVRITGNAQRKPRSLERVRKEIRETLKPTRYRNAVEQLQDDVLKQVNVTYSTSKQLHSKTDTL